jgi:hypothetical protein
VIAVMWLQRLWLRRQVRRSCWHHEFARPWPEPGKPADSLVVGKLIDLGRRKMFRCTRCGKTEIV